MKVCNLISCTLLSYVPTAGIDDSVKIWEPYGEREVDHAKIGTIMSMNTMRRAGTSRVTIRPDSNLLEALLLQALMCAPLSFPLFADSLCYLPLIHFYLNRHQSTRKRRFWKYCYVSRWTSVGAFTNSLAILAPYTTSPLKHKNETIPPYAQGTQATLHR